MSKLVFVCNACGAKGTIKLEDDVEAECCPVCGNSLDVEAGDEEDFEE